jgi:hypothetical protein
MLCYVAGHVGRRLYQTWIGTGKTRNLFDDVEKFSSIIAQKSNFYLLSTKNCNKLGNLF